MTTADEAQGAGHELELEGKKDIGRIVDSITFSDSKIREFRKVIRIIRIIREFN